MFKEAVKREQEIIRLKDEISRLTENQRLQDSATAKRNALEQAANACQDDESGRDGGGYFAEIIRALMKEGGE